MPSSLPQASTSYITERLGITAVAAAIAGMGQIWRETPTGDVGIDGQVEYVNIAGQATGQLISVQVKSGRSYLLDEVQDNFRFYPRPEHRRYWEQHPLPVMLVLHDPDTGLSYWADVRQQLRADTPEVALRVPKIQLLQDAAPKHLFQTLGVCGEAFIEDLNEVVSKMVLRRSKNGSFPVSHFDLFVHGLTNVARSIYFGMDVAIMVAEENLAANGSEFGVGIGGTEHDFLFEFVQFLIAQNIARVDYADCLHDWVDRQMQPHFVAPLTSRGRALVRHVHSVEAEMVASRQLPDGGFVHVAQEAFFEMNPLSFSTRIPRIRAFQDILLEASRI